MGAVASFPSVVNMLLCLPVFFFFSNALVCGHLKVPSFFYRFCLFCCFFFFLCVCVCRCPFWCSGLFFLFSFFLFVCQFLLIPLLSLYCFFFPLFLLFILFILPILKETCIFKLYITSIGLLKAHVGLLHPLTIDHTHTHTKKKKTVSMLSSAVRC